MSDDRFNVIVHHDGQVEAHEEPAEVEIGDASGLNSDVEVEGEIEVETNTVHVIHPNTNRVTCTMLR